MSDAGTTVLIVEDPIRGLGYKFEPPDRVASAVTA